MVTSHDSAEVLNLTFTAKYSNEQIFKYFLIAEAITCVYSLILLFIYSQISLWRLVLILGDSNATFFKCFSSISNSSFGQEGKQSCRLATNLWTSS
ncbi:hypothetical protein RJT34_24233 [Clitoria ternatea]|uniref:CASP-like protein n=1 Tax=Clitoria ternatea TaxID=43366 RepID=A0AAN9IHA6_CLITE